VLPDTTIAIGQATSIAGIGQVSVGDSGIELDGQTLTYAPGVATFVASGGSPVYVADGQTYTADSSSNIVVAPDVTVTAGGSAAIVSGTTFSVDSTGGGLVVNSVTATRSSTSPTEGDDSSSSITVPQVTGNLGSRSDPSKFGLGWGLCLMIWTLI